METKEAILYVLNSARYVTSAYLNDLNDAEIYMCPVPGAHHIAWQLGHLIISEAMMAGGVRDGSGILLPTKFIENHGKQQADELHNGSSPEQTHSAAASSSVFPYTKSQYLELRSRQRERTLELVESITDVELAAPGPEKMRSYAPTNGAALLAIGTHELMHSGQWAVVRRMLGKPIVV